MIPQLSAMPHSKDLHSGDDLNVVIVANVRKQQYILSQIMADFFTSITLVLLN